MATIPVQRTPSVETQPVRYAEQDIRATADSFGAGQARALQEGGAALMKGGAAIADATNQLAEADRRLKTREDSLTAIRVLNKARERANELVLAEERGGDLSQPENVKKLRDLLDGEFTRMENEFQSRLPEGRLGFLEDMARLRGQFNDHLTNKGLAAGKAALDQEGAKELSNLAGIVAANPAALADATAQWRKWIERRYAPSEDPAATEAKLAAGVETLAVGVVDFHLKNGKYDDALRLMADPNVQPYLGPDKARELRLRVYAGQGKAEEARAQAQVKIDMIETVIGKGNVTPQMKASIIAGMNFLPQTQGKTLADKVREFELSMRIATGNPNYSATPDQVEKLAGAAIADQDANPFKNRGAMAKYLLDNAERVRTGTATPAELNTFVAAAGLLQEADPVTKTQVQLPLPVREALEAQGIAPHLLGSQAGVPALQTARGAAPAAAARPLATQPLAAADAPTKENAARQAIEGTVDALAQAAADAPTLADGSQDPRAVVQAVAAKGVKLYDAADMMTGPLASMTESLSGTAFIARAVRAPQTREAMRVLQVFRQSVAAVLSKTDRYGDAEKKDLMTRVLGPIDTKFLGDPIALRDDLVAIDNVLAEIKRHGEETLQKEGLVSGERYNKIKDTLDEIAYLRKMIGAPPLVSTEDELYQVIRERGLKPGDKINWKGTIVRIKELPEPGGGR